MRTWLAIDAMPPIVFTNLTCLSLAASAAPAGQQLTNDVTHLMAEGDVPGLSMAVISDGKVVRASA
jgi:CubicO group peptidase (beta-lactamase class C family)